MIFRPVKACSSDRSSHRTHPNAQISDIWVKPKLVSAQSSGLKYAGVPGRKTIGTVFVIFVDAVNSGLSEFLGDRQTNSDNPECGMSEF